MNGTDRPGAQEPRSGAREPRPGAQEPRPASARTVGAGDPASGEAASAADTARPTSPLIVLPVALALLTEAAWTAVLAGLLQEFVLRPPTLGLIGTLVACVAGLVAARRLPARLGERWPTVAAGLAAAAGALGWLASPDVWSTLATGGLAALPDALLVNPGGWVAGVAFVRGIAHARLPPDPRPIANVLAVGTPGIAVAAILGGMVADPWRTGFLTESAVEVVVFLVAGLGALALSRLTLVGSGSGSGVDWRRNPSWLAMLVVLLLGIAGAAVAASLVAGPAIVAVIGALVPSLLVLGLIAGFDRRSLRLLALSAAVALLLGQLLRMIGSRPRTGGPVPIGGTTAPAEQSGTGIVAGVLVLAVIAGVIAVLVLVRMWMRRPREVPDELAEERWIDRGEVGERDMDRHGRRRSRFRRPAPTDAVAAYRRLLEDLAGHPVVRREAGETPAEHAGRLREAGWGSLSLDLLAADYGLVRFGGRELTEAEERRAIGRAASLRRRLVALAPTIGTGEEAGGQADRPSAEAQGGSGPGARSRFRVG